MAGDPCAHARLEIDPAELLGARTRLILRRPWIHVKPRLMHDAGSSRADEAGIAEAARLIVAGEPVAVPTETVYGLAADATNAEAVARIYEAKGRPTFNPLIVHVRDLAAAERDRRVRPKPRGRSPSSHWPGALTLVVPLRGTAASPIHRHRRPADDRGPRAGPSGDAGAARRRRPPARRAVGQCAADRSARPRAEHVLPASGGRIPLVHRRRPDTARPRIDDRRSHGGPLRLLRPGPIDVERSPRPAASTRQRIEAPGQLASHYAPAKPLRLDAIDAAARRVSDRLRRDCRRLSHVSRSGDLVEAAAQAVRPPPPCRRVRRSRESRSRRFPATASAPRSTIGCSRGRRA